MEAYIIKFGSAANTGNVGIGTTNPLTLLETTGAIHAHDASQGPDNGYNGLIRVTRTPASGQYINLTRNGNVVWSLGTVYNSNTFAIGVGQVTDSAFTAPTLNINTAGNVGIGTTSPAAKLDVSGGAGNVQIRLNAGSYYGLIQEQSNNVLLILNGGSGGMYLSGTGATAWTANSDRRLKHNINPLPASTLDRIMALNPVTYHWKDAKQDEAQGLQLGFIAQQVEDVFPEIVSHGGTTTITLANGEQQTIDNTLGVAQTALISPLVKSVQELKAEKDAEIAAIKARADRAEAESARLKADSKAKEAEIAQLRNFLCGQFPNAPMCHHP